ncbi:MAG TPA: hypothetical protein VFG59_04360 [Anaeromyxobacter sp.]|nr:hypothetical protein [Anaeromyxobacter sp.]
MKAKQPKAAQARRLVGIRLEPKHIAALRAEALRRVERRGKGRIDVSEVVRDLVKAWMKDRR